MSRAPRAGPSTVTFLETAKTVNDPSTRVLVLRAAGTNCDEETAFAFRCAGATVESLHVGTLLRGERQLDEFSILVIPGGFSYGDDLGAGTVLANQIACHLRESIARFVSAGRLVLGICNGFQVLVRLGLVPGWDDDAKSVSLVANASGRFEDRWIDLRIDSEVCPFLVGPDAPAQSGSPQLIRLPVAHAEGRFVVRDPDVLSRLREQGQVALTYVSPGAREGFADTYPANPNGSVQGIAGITNRQGNVLGLMPHPERFLRLLHDPSWTRRVRAGGLPEGERSAGDGFRFFERAVRYCRSRAAHGKGIAT